MHNYIQSNIGDQKFFESNYSIGIVYLVVYLNKNLQIK